MSREAKVYGLKPTGVFIVFPGYSPELASFSAQYRAFTNTLHNKLLDVVKRESKLLIKIDLIDLALPYINISSVIYSTLDTGRNTFLNLRGSMKDKDLSKLITRTHECFEIAKELIDTLDLLAIIYIAHLGLWISNNDLLGMLRSFIKSYVSEKEKALVILASASRDEIEKSDLSCEKLGCLPTILKLKLLET